MGFLNDSAPSSSPRPARRVCNCFGISVHAVATSHGRNPGAEGRNGYMSDERHTDDEQTAELTSRLIGHRELWSSAFGGHRRTDFYGCRSSHARRQPCQSIQIRLDSRRAGRRCLLTLIPRQGRATPPPVADLILCRGHTVRVGAGWSRLRRPSRPFCAMASSMWPRLVRHEERGTSLRFSPFSGCA